MSPRILSFSCSRFAIVFVIFSLFHVTAVCQAQSQSSAKPKPVPPKAKIESRPAELDEELFLLYAFEDLLRQWPEFFTNPRDLRAFVAQQKLLVDKIRTRIQTGKLSPELLDLFKGYRTALEGLDSHMEAFDRLEQRFWQPVKGHLQEYKAASEALQAQANAKAMRSAADYGLASGGGLFSSPFDMLFGAAIGGIMGHVSSQIEAAPKRRRLWNQTQKKITNYINNNTPVLLRELKSLNEKLTNARKSKAGTLRKDAGKTALNLAKARKWSDSEIPFQGQADQQPVPENRPRDPFLLLDQVRQSARKGKKEGEELIEQAKALVAANQLIPPKIATYKFYRAAIWGSAGQLLNRACDQNVGLQGFGSLTQKKWAKAAEAAWKQYHQEYPTDSQSNPSVRLEILKSLAYSGKLSAAYGFVTESKIQSSDPRYYALAARVMALIGGKHRVQRYKQICFQKAFTLLRSAVALGMDNLEELKLNPDFEALKRHDKVTFDKILTRKVNPLAR